jgi:hypothetical protein
MISKPVALGLLVFAIVTAAAGGAYVAMRQNGAPASVSAVPTQPAGPEQSAAAPDQPQPVAETEAVVAPPAVPVENVETTAAAPARKNAPEKRAATARPDGARPAPAKTPASNERATQPTVERGSRPADPISSSPSAPAVERPSSVPARDQNAAPSSLPAAPPLPDITPSEPPPPVKPQLIEVVVPASSVVGLKVETPLSSETARVEDRVEARVIRDVMADGRLAIPAGTRVLGDVTLVERGGKMKDKARLGVRFHTLVLADGTQVPFRTDAIMREGSSPGSESARKIGGAAIGGAIIGAIMGGAKGAAIGGATGAGAGSAVVMAGDRNAATLPSGTAVTVRLNSPVTVDVEKEF